MTSAEKLEALIQRAIEGGWNVFGLTNGMNIKHKGSWEVEYDEPSLKIYYWNIGKTSLYDSHGIKADEFSIIFNHDFAKALCGERDYTKMEYPDEYKEVPGSRQYMTAHDQAIWDKQGWQYHLQQAVISDNPIEYFYREVFENA